MENRELLYKKANAKYRNGVNNNNYAKSDIHCPVLTFLSAENYNVFICLCFQQSVIYRTRNYH